MLEKRNIYFVFPVFNESLNIPRVGKDLHRLAEIVAPVAKKTEFVFVDDGSTDNTVTLLRELNQPHLSIVEHGHNRGPGAAFQTAFSYLLERQIQPEDLIITLEGDATSDPTVLERMLKRVSEGDDLILASPYLYGGGFSDVALVRILLSHIANFLFKLILNIHGLATFSCFFRIYRGTALLRLNETYPNEIVTCPGFDCAAEIILKAVRNRLAISEVPFRVDWSRRKGRSKMKIIKTSVAYLKLFIRFSLLNKKKAIPHENSDNTWREAPIR